MEKFAMTEPREYTAEEIREIFLDYVRNLVNFCEKETRKETLRERLESLAFHILVAIDGESALPPFILAPLPNSTDKAYYIENGKNYYPENNSSLIKGDIGGYLHDNFYKKKNEK